MEEEKVFRIKIAPETDIKETLVAIKSTASTTLGFRIGEPKIIITENGEKEIVVPFHDYTVDEDVRKSK